MEIAHRRKRIKGLKNFLIAIPFLIFVIAFSYVPIAGWIYAFFKYDVGTIFYDLSNAEFRGLDFFAQMIRGGTEILRVLRNTLVMSLLNILVSPLPVAFAILLNDVRNKTYRKIVQTTTTLPHFISWIIVFSLAFSMFSMGGFVNTALKALNLSVPDIPLMGNVKAVWPFQLFIGLWKSLGWSTIIYIAAISGIDPELYDAAKVDGASKFREIWHITVPGIAPTYLVLFLLGISNLLNTGFEQYFMFFNSLIADRIEVLDYYVYRMGILIGDYSYSIAVGMLKSLISIMLLFIGNHISKRIRGQSLV